MHCSNYVLQFNATKEETVLCYAIYVLIRDHFSLQCLTFRSDWILETTEVEDTVNSTDVTLVHWVDSRAADIIC